MTRLLSILAGILAGMVLMAVLATSVATARPALPAPSLRVYPLDPTPFPSTPTPEPVHMIPSINPSTAVGRLGLEGKVECWNCAPFTQAVHISHYDPMIGAVNCWDYDLKNSYCYSPTKPGLAWKGLWGLGAACPLDWPYGTWVVIPDVGAFICLDRGGSIVCDPQTRICNVDILGPTRPWDGKVVTATLWVPLDPPRGK